MPDNKEDVTLNFLAITKRADDAIDRLMQRIEALKQAAGNINIGMGGGGGRGGGGAPTGAQTGGTNNVVTRSAQGAGTPIGTPQRGTPTVPISVSPGNSGMSIVSPSVDDYYTRAIQRPGGGIRSFAGNRFGPMLPGHQMSSVRPGYAYDPSTTGGPYGMYPKSFPSDNVTGPAERSWWMMEQALMNPRTVPTWGLSGGGRGTGTYTTPGGMTGQFPSEMYAGGSSAAASSASVMGVSPMSPSQAANMRARGMQNVGILPSPLAGTGFASDRGMGPAAQSAAVMRRSMWNPVSSFGAGAESNFWGSGGGYEPWVQGGMITASMWGQEQFGAMMKERMTGRADYMGRASAQGAAIGSLIGLAIGAPMGGAGSYVGAFTGGMLGSSVAQYIESGSERQRVLAASLMPLGALSANLYGDFGINTGGFAPSGQRQRYGPSFSGAKRFADQARRRATGIADLYFGEREDQHVYSATAEQLAGSYETSYQALISAGIDPEQRTLGVAVGGKGQRSKASRDLEALGKQWQQRGSLSALGVDMQTRAFLMPKETVSSIEGLQKLFEYLSENAGKRYGSASQEVMDKVIGPILSQVNLLGGGQQGSRLGFGNMTDVFFKFGPQMSAQYAEAITPFGKSPEVTLRDTMSWTRTFQQNQYQINRANLGIRGVGAATEALYGERMRAIEGMPGGRDSIAFLETQRLKRQSMFQNFEEQDAIEFGVPMTRAMGERDRSRMMPFGGGNAYSNELRVLGLQAGHLSHLEKRFATLKEGNQLSEMQELAEISKIETAKTQVTASVVNLSEGMEQYLPSLMAGGTKWSGRFNTMNLAAMRLGRLGSVSREFGATGGSHLMMQDNFLRSMGMAGVGGVGAPSSNAVVENLLREIRDLLRGSGGSGARPTEARGAASSAARRSGVDPNALYNNSN